MRTWKPRTVEQLKQRQEKRARRRRLLVESRGSLCSICKRKFKAHQLDFHHRDGKEKRFALSSAGMTATKWETIIEEMEKCDLVCANCHRDMHHNERKKHEDADR